MKYFIIIGMLCSLLVPSAMASGGGGGGGFGGGGFGGSSGGGTKKRGIDYEKYQLGQKVYAGKGLASQVISRAALKQQATSLKKLQKQIAKKSSVAQAKKLDVRRLAGRMSNKQLNALKYFVKIRYKKKKSY